MVIAQELNQNPLTFPQVVNYFSNYINTIIKGINDLCNNNNQEADLAEKIKDLLKEVPSWHNGLSHVVKHPSISNEEKKILMFGTDILASLSNEKNFSKQQLQKILENLENQKSYFEVFFSSYKI
ncbi:hypothetical protein [Wolbachia endosymbiont of Pentidionis agamae]|uniref:hypothetical protein n=1 Tax=Wolbachia endosymbiont of Pentidionis agamae TaxID=3110435 RepID=UPI002FCF1E24